MRIPLVRGKTLLTVNCVLLLLVLHGGLAIAGRLYKWIDKDGNVQFSDSIPPDQADNRYFILKRDGAVDRVVERAKTPEELKQEREKERLREESKKVEAAQNEADRILLRTFRTEKDIEIALKTNLDTVELQITAAQSNIRRYQLKLTDLQEKQAANLEKSAKPLSKKLRDNIEDTLKRINDTYGIIQQKKRNQQAIRDDFARSMKRFQVLKNLNTTDQVSKDEGLPTFLDTLIPCGEGSSCDEAWVRAEAFVLKYATTQIQIQGEFIIMAKAPKKDDDISITISRIRLPKQPVVLFMDLFCKNSTKGQELCASPKVNKIRKAYRQEVGLSP